MTFMGCTRSAAMIGSFALVASAAVAQEPAQVVLRDDLYIAGSNVVVSQDVPGDLVAAGRMVVVKGKVVQDALVAGGRVEIAGDVGDVLRVAGGTVTVGGDVGGYVVAGGGTVDLLPAGTVENGLFITAGQAIVDGRVNGPLEIRGGEALINGTVEGDVKVYAGKVSLGEHAVLKQDLQYTSKGEAKVAPGAQVLGSMRRLEEPGGRSGRGMALVPTLASFFGLIVAGLAVVLVFPRFARAVTTESLAHFGRDFLVGGGVLILVPVVAVLLVVSLVGLPLGLIGGFAYVTLLLISRICAGLVLGTLVWRLVRKEKKAGVDWKTAVVGLALLPAIAWIPILGWAAWLALILVALGSVSLLAYRGLWPGRGPQAAETGSPRTA
jgi:cytoskeletal protein CcmA (bactofilin family)